MLWILIADRGRARICARQTPVHRWETVATFENPDGRLREGELQSDRPPLFSAQGENRYAAEPHVDHRHSTAAAFSKALIHHLDLARQGNKFQELWIVAPPLMLGELRDHLPSPLAALVKQEWDKDVTNLPDHELWDQLERLSAGA